ncbi:hypothetical protein LOK49_Contig286G00001 [Camellia lanceoleosa]|nr:hypothetical protein LOK49_Contig286G00001 [Camellia lanceoleosa]
MQQYNEVELSAVGMAIFFILFYLQLEVATTVRSTMTISPPPTPTPNPNPCYDLYPAAAGRSYPVYRFPKVWCKHFEAARKGDPRVITATDAVHTAGKRGKQKGAEEMKQREG